MRRVLASAVIIVACALAPERAPAQENWLLGDWLATYMDPRGLTNWSVTYRFESNRLVTFNSASGGAGSTGMMIVILAYRMTGPSSYQAQVVDYEPKQRCGLMIGCVPVAPLVPLDTIQNCQVQQVNAIAMTLSCNGDPPLQFTRQNR